MSALALILKHAGCQVSGSDSTESEFTRRLRDAAIAIASGHDPRHIPEDTQLVVYSSAITGDNPELLRARQSAIPAISRGHLLALVSRHLFRRTIAVAGSHGKTSTAAMLSWILVNSGRNPGFLIGGLPGNLPAHAALGDQSVLVCEVDESDGSQELLYPDLTLITNIDDDHCWSFPTPEGLVDCFHRLILQSRRVFVIHNELTRENLKAVHYPHLHWIPAPSSYLPLSIPGKHHQLNAALALAAAEAEGISHQQGLHALSSFEGVDRRFSIRYRSEQCTLLEDYAHHPTELACTLDAMKQMWPHQKLTVVFQPHRYERIARYAAGFAECLQHAHQVWIYRPFAAWLDDTERADPREIVHHLRHRSVSAEYLDGDDEHVAQRIIATLPSPSILAIIGAGDIHNLIEPLIEKLKENDR